MLLSEDECEPFFFLYLLKDWRLKMAILIVKAVLSRKWISLYMLHQQKKIHFKTNVSVKVDPVRLNGFIGYMVAMRLQWHG
jgi:hypothetical protein